MSIPVFDTIKRSAMLRLYDMKETPQGKQSFFSIRFVTKKGELVFLPRAVATGLPFNVAQHRMRGVVAVDIKMDKIGHIYPVSIDNILEFNNKKVIL